MGRGVVKHAAQDTDTLTLCKKRIAGPSVTIDNWVTCTACVRAAKKINTGETTMAKTDEVTRNDVNTDEGRAVVEQIDANIERARSLRDAEALKGLARETDALISSLSGKGSVNIKKLKHETWNDSASDALAVIDVDGEGISEVTRVDVDSDEGKAVIEQIDASIERARSLTAADALPSLSELKVETETLISSLSGKGVAAIKASKRAAWSEAEAFALKAIEAANSEPAAQPSTEVAEHDAVMAIEGMPDLIAAGAERIAEGVRLHIKASATAMDLARIGLDMWRRIPNKDGNPDLPGDSDRAKKASGMLKTAAAEALREAYSEDEGFDVSEALEKLWRSVTAYRSDVRAEYLRGLDGDSEEAEVERQRFANLLADKPDDVPVSKWVADAYGLSLKGQAEIKRERYRAKMAALAKGEKYEEPKDGAVQLPAIERGKVTVKSVKRDLSKFTPEDVKAMSPQEREELKPEIQAVFETAKALMAEFL